MPSSPTHRVDAGQSYRMLADTATVGFWTGTSKTVGALKVFLAARLFGTGDAMDAYLIAFLIPSFVADVVASPIEAVLLPAFVRARATSEQTAERLYSEVLLAGTVALIVLALIAVAVSGLVLPLLGASFEAEKLGYTRLLFFAMVLVIPLSGPWVTARSVLNAQGRFALAAALPSITPGVCIVVLLAAGHRWGVNSLALATTGGIALQAGAAVAAVGFSGIRVRAVWTGVRNVMRDLGGEYLPLLFLSILSGASVLIDQAFAGRLPAGSVSTFSYGTRLPAVLMVLGPVAVGTVVLAHASNMFRTRGVRLAQRALGRYSAVAFAVSLLGIVLLMSVSEPLLRIILGARAFTAQQIHAIAQLQTVALLQVPLAILLAIGIRVIAAARQNRLLYGVAVITLLATAALDVIFVRLWGLMGIAVAGSAVRLVSVLYVFCKIHSFRREEFTAGAFGSVS